MSSAEGAPPARRRPPDGRVPSRRGCAARCPPRPSPPRRARGAWCWTRTSTSRAWTPSSRGSTSPTSRSSATPCAGCEATTAGTPRACARRSARPAPTPRRARRGHADVLAAAGGRRDRDRAHLADVSRRRGGALVPRARAAPRRGVSGTPPAPRAGPVLRGPLRYLGATATRRPPALRWAASGRLFRRLRRLRRGRPARRRRIPRQVHERGQRELLRDPGAPEQEASADRGAVFRARRGPGRGGSLSPRHGGRRDVHGPHLPRGEDEERHVLPPRRPDARARARGGRPRPAQGHDRAQHAIPNRRFRRGGGVAIRRRRDPGRLARRRGAENRPYAPVATPSIEPGWTTRRSSRGAWWSPPRFASTRRRPTRRGRGAGGGAPAGALPNGSAGRARGNAPKNHAGERARGDPGEGGRERRGGRRGCPTRRGVGAARLARATPTRAGESAATGRGATRSGGPTTGRRGATEGRPGATEGRPREEGRPRGDGETRRARVLSILGGDIFGL